MEKVDENHPFILKRFSSDKKLILKSNQTSAPAYILESLCEECNSIEHSLTGIVDGVSGQGTEYSEFENLSRRVASGLYRHGFQNGETLIYASDDPARLHVFLLGVWRANGILRASYPEDTPEILLGRIQESKCRWILCDTENAREVKSSCEQLPWVVNVISFGGATDEDVITAESLFSDDGISCPELQLRREDIAAIMPTSGTTGRSKGVIITHERLLTNLMSVKDSLRVEDKFKTLLHLGKSTHVSALMNFKFIAERRNLVRVRSKDYTPETLINVIKRNQPVEVTINGFLMRKLLDHTKSEPTNLNSLKLINLIGTAVPSSTISELKNLPGCPTVCLLYGSTETLSLCYADSSDIIDKISAGATGKLVSGVQMVVLSENGDIHGPLHRGELWFKSKHSSVGYYNNAKETEESFQNGWIRTGDVGFYDNEGIVHIAGRVKEVFKFKGNHVSPFLIEEALNTHPSVADVGVVGIIDPNGMGHIPKAYVILKSTTTTPSSEELISYANGRLPPYMHLRGGLEFRDEFPCGPGGKVQRHLLT